MSSKISPKQKGELAPFNAKDGLYKLSSKKFKKLFLDTMTEKALNEDKDTYYYSLTHAYKKRFHGIDLEDLIFKADNYYQLWLLVYEYLLKNSRQDEKKTVVSFTDSTRCITTKIITLDERDEYDMADFEEDDIEDMITSADGDTTKEIMESIVHNAMNDLFTNETLWVREVKSDRYEDEDTDDDSDDSDGVEESKE